MTGMDDACTQAIYTVMGWPRRFDLNPKSRLQQTLRPSPTRRLRTRRERSKKR